MLNASLKELSAALAQRKISSVELTRLFLERVEKLNGSLNAFITVDAEKSLAQARAADERITKGATQPLTGIPVAHKDIFVTRSWLTTCGSRILSNFVSPYDAHVIERFNGAGAVILGKTNMDEFAMGSSSETSFYGPVKNPWGQAYVPGGSSGGSAAAVAARMAPAATGTDTGGSIRQPAALSGGSGVETTHGLVSRYGLIALASRLEQGGPLARSASRSVCRTAVFRFRRTTSSRPQRPRRTCRASTACATAIARRSTATSPTCIGARAPKASVPKSGAASLSGPTCSRTATTTRTTSRHRRSGG